MLKSNSEKFNSSIELVAGFRKNTKKELGEMAKLLGLSISSTLRKEEYATAFAEAILLFPDQWLPQLTLQELTLLRTLVDAGPNTYVEEPYVLINHTLTKLSLIITDQEPCEVGRIRYMIYDELREAVAPYLDALLHSEKQAIQSQVEQYVMGMVNLYGILPYSEMQEKLYDYLQHSISKQDIHTSMVTSVLIRHFCFQLVDTYSRTFYVESPYLEDFEYLDKQLQLSSNKKTNKPFSAQEVAAAGEIAFPRIPNPCTDELKKHMMTQLGYSVNTANYYLLFLWQAMQSDVNPVSVILSVFDIKQSSMENLQENIGLFTRYCNQCPRWYLRGYSPQEISQFEKPHLKQSPPRIVPPSLIKAATMNVGRNEPCPCGSGKKYKQCCGK